MERAGFRCLAAVDFNPEAVTVFRKNFPEIRHALEKDLTQFTPNKMAALIGDEEVDVIVGGPPCQGYPQSIDKVQQIMDSFGIESDLMRVDSYQWTRSGLLVFVQPWPDKPYQYAIMIAPAEKLPTEEYHYYD